MAFRLSGQDEGELGKLATDVSSKVSQWDHVFNGFFEEYDEAANSYRMLPRKFKSKRPDGLFNSRTGETNRATNTLASLQFRMLTNGDPPFELEAFGYDDFGKEIPEFELYGTEALINRQNQALHYKPELLKALRSLDLMGSVIIAEEWKRVFSGSAMGWISGTGFRLSPLIQTAFDPFTFDIGESDWICPIDFHSAAKLRAYSKSDPYGFDPELIQKIISETEANSGTIDSETYTRIIDRKSRAGYNVADFNIYEVTSYHGRIDTENPVVQALWSEIGDGSDPADIDWIVRVINGTQVVGLWPCPSGSWHRKFKTASVNQFELEPIGYGVGRTGSKYQKELDTTQSRVNDLMMSAALNMWKIGRFAGLKGKLAFAPNRGVELDDISQLEPLRPPIEAIPAIMAMLNTWKDDFRTITGATSNLQASVTTATSATEAGLAQNEAMRGNGVMAEIIAETLIREDIETKHLNNLELLDEDVWVNVTGFNKPAAFNKRNIPRFVGFKVKVSTDRDYRPEVTQKLLQTLQIATSIRSIIPESVNVIRPILEHLFRSLGINPRLLSQPVPVRDQLMMRLARSKSGGAGNELAGEMAGEAADGNVNVSQTPVGPVLSSPSSMDIGEAA